MSADFTSGATNLPSRISPCTRRTGPRVDARLRFSGRPRTMLSRATISVQPSSHSRSTMWEPINPAPPVTRTRFPLKSAKTHPPVVHLFDRQNVIEQNPIALRGFGEKDLLQFHDHF